MAYSFRTRFSGGGSIFLPDPWCHHPHSGANFGESPECELRHNGVPRSFTTENRSSRAVPLALGADLGAFLRLVLLRGALGNPHERHPKRRPQRREHKRECPDRRRQQRYLRHDEGTDHQPFPGHGGGGDLQHIEDDGRRYSGEAPAGGEADQRDVVRPLNPRATRSPRATAAKRSARIPAEASIRDIVSQPPASFSAWRCLRVPKSLPRMPKASMTRAQPTPPRPRTKGVAGRRDGVSADCTESAARLLDEILRKKPFSSASRSWYFIISSKRGSRPRNCPNPVVGHSASSASNICRSATVKQQLCFPYHSQQVRRCSP